MFEGVIEGLDNVIETEIPKDTIILLAGSPGSLKSGICYSMFSNYLRKNKKEFGIYVTLEESTESHLRNMESLGIKLPKNLLLSDYSDIRMRFEDKSHQLNLIQMLEGMIEYFKTEKGKNFTIFGLDSLNALYALIDTSNLRIKMFHFFKGLREKGLTSVLIMEIPDIFKTSTKLGSEFFLVDGIIKTGEIESHQDVMLYLQVRKMRATRHSRKKHLVEVGKNGITILGPIFE
ncbi:MAG: signal transduction protein [Thermoplasmata archaeon]|nr:signal transduction protein [Thermoplasmata archaeon]